MRLKITNNRQGAYGVEQVGGGFVFIEPGATRTVDAVNPRTLYKKDFLDVEAAQSEVSAPPPTMKAAAAKVGRHPLDHDGDGRKGGSRKGSRRRKAAKR